MPSNKEDKGWSPYLAGGLSGLLAILSVGIAGKYLGASTTFVRSAGMIERWFVPGRVASLDYFQMEVPKIDWQWMFVIGIVVGSFISATSSRTFHWKGVPDMWESRFGSGRFPRALVAFIGGAIAVFGARLADG